MQDVDSYHNPMHGREEWVITRQAACDLRPPAKNRRVEIIVP